MKRRLSIIIALVSIFTTQSAMAWGGFGHGSIAYMAEQLLTPHAKERCRHYLGHTLPYYASWMDHWRTVPPYSVTNGWHSFKTDETGVVVNSKAAYNTDRIWKEMKNYKSLPDSLIRQNLLILIHMVPDMHCPVHVGYSRKAVPEKHGKMTRRGKPYKFHAFWDGSPGFKRKGWTFERYNAEVNKLTPKQAKKITKGSLDKWLNDIADNAKRCFTITPEYTEITDMTPEQISEVHRLADAQALKGAYRLAYILNDIFKE